MLVVAFHEFGGSEVLQVLELPLPVAGSGEVVVRVAASTVNPTDLLMRSGRQAGLMTSLKPPFVAGMEFSGHVHAVGPDVQSLRKGQPVMGLVNPRRPAGGAHAEYLCVPASSVVPLHAGIDLVNAATVPMNGLTALMVIEMLGLPPGATLLVTGGAGAVGGYVIPMARSQGWVTIAVGKAEDAALLKALGAEIVLPRGEALAAAVLQSFPGGVDGLVDTALISDRVSKAVRDGGVAVSLRRSNPITDARLRASYVGVLDRVGDTASLAQLAQMLEQGVLMPRVAHRLPMHQARRAHDLVEKGGLRGRVVLTF